VNGRLLFDASSLLYALKLKNPRILYNYIRWLTIYEVTNALWKEASLLGTMSLSEAERIIEFFVRTVEFMRLLTPHPHEGEVLTIADRLGISAYDASYVFLAERMGLTLVTEDRKLRGRAERLIDVVSLDEIT